MTLADLLVVCISPILIMLVVGSLCFFLIEVFGSGEAVNGLRWVMFWFVLAIVLVSRIGIEQGTGHAMVYGLGLAAAVWMYMTRIFPEWFVLNMILLAIVWWCANKLVWDCTLINDDEDASGSGLLQSAAAGQNFFQPLRKSLARVSDEPDGKRKRQPHAPGLWLVYFSLAALPFFGIGEMLLPRGDSAARQVGFVYLFVYLAAAFGLLVATSFLGLRRYLRQRQLQMPASIAFAWIRFGAFVAAFILIAALLLPRPGAGDAWMTLRHQLDYRLRQASEFAMRFSPHGTGKGRSGNASSNSNPQNNPTGKSQPQNQTGGQAPSPGDQNSGQNQNPGQKQPLPFTNPSFDWFRGVFFFIVALLIGCWIFRRRALILQAIQSIIASIADFFRKLLGFRFSLKRSVAAANEKTRIRRSFAEFHNPFLTGKEQSWTQAQLILYTYEALRAWAEEHDVAPHPEQTAREFCAELGKSFPEIISELNQLSSLYGRAAYGMEPFKNQNLEPLKELWRYFYIGAEREFASRS